MRRKKILIVFLGVTIINFVIVFFRDHFAYKPYASYSSLYSLCDSPCVLTWKHFIQDYSPEELDKAKMIMDTVIKHKDAVTYSTIEETGKFLYNKFHKQDGTPYGNILKATPLEQFSILSSDNSAKLWCGNYAEMFAFFCWSQNIVCRVIEIFNEGDHHVLNECYIPEDDQWVMVDVTFNQLLTKNKTNRFISLVDFRNLLIKGEPLFELKASEDTVIIKKIDTTDQYIKNYYKKEKPICYYHEVNLKKVYNSFSRIKRYFLPVSWYDVYDRNKGSNLPFYIKQFFLLIWLFVFVLLVFSILKKT